MAQHGKMDRRIVIQKRTVSQDAAGGTDETWVDFAFMWAEKVDERGNESEMADSDRADNETKWRVRYREFLVGLASSSTYRVKYKSEFYDLKHTKEEGRKDTHLLTTVATEAIS